MKKTITLTLFLAITTFSFAQQTFTSKQEALKYLKESFETNFIKTTVYKTNDKENIPFKFDFEIRNRQIIIWRVSDKDAKGIDKEKDLWINIPFEKIGEILIVDKSDVFKDLTGLALKPPFGEYFVLGNGEEISDNYIGGGYSTTLIFPFMFSKNKKERESMMHSLPIAINFISNEINKDGRNADLVKKSAQQKKDSIQQGINEDDRLARLAAGQEIEGTLLPPFEVFTSENIRSYLPDYIDKNRPFKNKPTLLITWSNVYCPPCIKIIDALLNNGVGLKYNIVLVNKEDEKTDFLALKTKISNHKPDYHKDAILLFDKNNQLEPLDKNSAPFFIWLDKNMKIVRSYAGYDISETIISNILAEIE